MLATTCNFTDVGCTSLGSKQLIFACSWCNPWPLLYHWYHCYHCYHWHHCCTYDMSVRYYHCHTTATHCRHCYHWYNCYQCGVYIARFKWIESNSIRRFLNASPRKPKKQKEPMTLIHPLLSLLSLYHCHHCYHCHRCYHCQNCDGCITWFKVLESKGTI